MQTVLLSSHRSVLTKLLSGSRLECGTTGVLVSKQISDIVKLLLVVKCYFIVLYVVVNPHELCP